MENRREAGSTFPHAGAERSATSALRVAPARGLTDLFPHPFVAALSASGWTTRGGGRILTRLSFHAFFRAPVEDSPVQKRPNATTLKGTGLTLLGPQLKPGDKAPDFTCATGMKDTLGLAQTPAKARLFSVVPSLDTGVCSIQTKKFNEGLTALKDKVACYTVSLDLPFAQLRFCGAEGIGNMKALSDCARPVLRQELRRAHRGAGHAHPLPRRLCR